MVLEISQEFWGSKVLGGSGAPGFLRVSGSQDWIPLFYHAKQRWLSFAYINFICFGASHTKTDLTNVWFALSFARFRTKSPVIKLDVFRGSCEKMT